MVPEMFSNLASIDRWCNEDDKIRSLKLSLSQKISRKFLISGGRENLSRMQNVIIPTIIRSQLPVANDAAEAASPAKSDWLLCPLKEIPTSASIIASMVVGPLIKKLEPLKTLAVYLKTLSEKKISRRVQIITKSEIAKNSVFFIII